MFSIQENGSPMIGLANNSLSVPNDGSSANDIGLLEEAVNLAREMGLDRSPLANISTPVIAAGVTIVAIAGYAALVRALNLDDLLVSDPAPATVLRDSAALTLFGVTTVVLAPVAEELLFRGLLMRKLLSLGAPVAIAGSAIVFAAWHVSPAIIPLVGVGAVLAWLYLRSATLWQPIIFHTIFNLVSFVQFAGHR